VNQAANGEKIILAARKRRMFPS